MLTSKTFRDVDFPKTPNSSVNYYIMFLIDRYQIAFVVESLKKNLRWQRAEYSCTKEV